MVVQAERTPGRFLIGLGVPEKPKPIAGCFLNDLSSFPVTEKDALAAFGDPREVLVQRDGHHVLRLFAVSTSGLSIPRIYRLNVDRTVSIDVAATRREASRMAKLYASASGEHRDFYRVASLAYEAFGAGRQCVTRR